MTILTCTYIAYLMASLFITVVVGHHLHHHGRPFLVHCFLGREPLADAVNHLLLVGYYIVNFALAALLLKSGLHPDSLLAACELLGAKTGTIMLILGVMHFNNVFVSLLSRRYFSNR